MCNLLTNWDHPWVNSGMLTRSWDTASAVLAQKQSLVSVFGTEGWGFESFRAC